jgi:tRNA G10  N-methylase Trm11
VGEVVYAATRWLSNAYMIEDVARLGYLSGRVLDPTCGRGVWWQRWMPEELVTSDLKDGVDFRNLPHPDASFDAVAFDPPYVSIGGRTTTGIPAMHHAYGLTEAPRSPQALQAMINEGMGECARVLRCGGYLLVKCCDYVSSGKLWLGTHHTLTHALSLGLECVDRFEYVGTPRPQPSGRRQVHARRNLSTLLVLRKP